jgi:HlyD family secretion protein
LEELLAGTRNEQVKAARARVSMARAAAELTKVQLRDSQIKAPFDCVVGERLVDEGTIVGPNQIVVSILEKPPLEASFGVPADAAERLRIGQTANLSIGKNSLDQPTIVGRVVRLQPKVDSITRTREVVVEFDTEEISLIGQSATLWLDRETPTNEVTSGASTRFWIPSEALVRNVRGLWGLYVAKTNRSDAADVVESGQEIDAIVGLTDAKIIQTAGLMSLVEAYVEPSCLVVADGTHRVGPNVKIIAQRNDD